mmetsp:Transcript_18247/g.37925  ORF Transcript_18247/g.37925 Transcript_18247/m.37925 type:complete len:285 (+) Transcript_18247:480-1334(+)
MDKGIQPLSNHILLHLGRGRSKCRGSKLLAGRRLRSRWSTSRRLRRDGPASLIRRSVSAVVRTGIPCLLVEFDGSASLLWRLSRPSSPSGGAIHWPSSPGYTLGSHPSREYTSPSGPSRNRTSSAASRLGRHHSIAGHGISRSSRLSSGGTALHAIPSSSTLHAHHLRHHGIRGLHSSRYRSGHVHRHSCCSRISSHGSGHGSSHHARLSGRISSGASPRLIMLGFQLSATDVSPLRQGDENGFPRNELSVHLIDRTGGILGSGITNEAEAARDSRLEVPHDSC